MNNEQLEITKEIAKNVSKDIYNDGFKGAVTQSGEILETVIGLFNNVALYPVKKANIKYQIRIQIK